MTPLDLLDAMKAFIEKETKDLILPVRVDRKSGEHKERPPEVYTMRLPDKDAETKRIPYVLCSTSRVTTRKSRGNTPNASAWCESLPRRIRRTRKRAHGAF